MDNECCVCNAKTNSSREKPIKIIAVLSPTKKKNVWVHPMCVLFARASHRKLRKITDVVSEAFDY